MFKSSPNKEPTENAGHEGMPARAGVTRRILIANGVVGATALSFAPSHFAFAQAACAPASCTIWAGQTLNVGTMTVSNDNTNLYITINMSASGSTFVGSESLKVWVGSDLTNLPKNPQGVPVPGQFPYKYNATGSTWGVTIPLVDAGIILPAGCGTTIYVVAHLDVTTPNVGANTAWGGCTAGATGQRWWFYMSYVLCCGTTPPKLGGCTTAFAKGGWVWVKDSRANPEQLPSLGLILNRWGWAINLRSSDPQVTTYDIWAGAGLNYTSKGAKVGTLTVDWRDSNGDGVRDTVTVTYNLSDGYRLSETHLFAASRPPTTTAPGQYGNLHYFTDVQDVSTDQYILPLVDDGVSDACGANTCTGVWIIAHAVVCDKNA